MDAPSGVAATGSEVVFSPFLPSSNLSRVLGTSTGGEKLSFDVQTKVVTVQLLSH